jgi:uncharacterized membrane protein SirB2
MLDFGAWLQDTRVSVTIQSVEWIIPLLQSIHIVMIGIVFISSLMITLRVLGRVRADEPFQAVWRRFAPWMWTGLVVMALTGAVLVVAEPIREFTALSFWLKMALVAIGVVTSAVFGRTMGRRAASAVPRTGSGAGTAEFRATGAASVTSGASYAYCEEPTHPVECESVAIWLAIIFLGRAIAYDVEVWGKLSLHG